MVVNGKEEDTEVKCLPVAMSRSIRASPVLELLQKCNSFFMQGFTSIQGECRPLVACGQQIGIIRPDVAYCLLNYPSVFTATPAAFYLNPQLDSYESRSAAVDAVLQDLRTKSGLAALRGWRDECFDIRAEFGADPLFKMERAAVTVLGVRAFGVHLTGLTHASDGSLYVWLQKRSATKPTWPGMMDTMIGGGICVGLSVSQAAAKEAEEEASVPEDVVIQNATPAGAVSFLVETERGIHANTEFVYDLELPNDFEPENGDGEVEGFERIPVKELLSRVLSSKYKLTSTPIAIDFLVRRGLINADNEPDLPAVQELLHVPLQQFYHQWPHQLHSSTPSSVTQGNGSCMISE